MGARSRFIVKKECVEGFGGKLLRQEKVPMFEIR